MNPRRAQTEYMYDTTTPTDSEHKMVRFCFKFCGAEINQQGEYV